ncbi:hypothetical protein GH863_30425 [Bacillus thuringiensis]|nr:hypothetical protein [Bacillus thuringiensis]
MKLDLIEKFIAWGLLGNLTDTRLAEEIQEAIDWCQQYDTITDKGLELAQQILEHEKSHSGLMQFMYDENTIAYDLYDLIDDVLQSTQPEDVSIDTTQQMLLVLLMGVLRNPVARERIEETVEDAVIEFEDDYEYDLEYLLDLVQDDPTRLVRLFDKLKGNLTKEGYFNE